MRNVTVNIQIQFDIPSDKETVGAVTETLTSINEVLQERFPDISPVIFTNSIDSSDITTDSRFTDKNGRPLEEGDSVDVPEPDEEDSWNFGFSGTIKSLDDDGYAIVEDMDGDCWTVECERLEIDN